jgi:molybdopterin synthase catalytic subunit/molybdopterin converting factor small subunit
LGFSASKKGYSFEIMRVHMLPFGLLKDVLSESAIDLPSHATVADLLAAVRGKLESQPSAAQLLPRIAVSVNAEYAHAGQILQEGDEVGLLPPVSGGSDAGGGVVVTYLTREPIPAELLVAAAKKGSDGAVVVFDGIVRDNTRGRRTLYLDYEAYEEMASRQIMELSEQAIGRFGVRGVTLVHRLGRLLVGETSVLIVVASAHRAAAYEASRWLIDTLKKTVPIWKKETFVDGAVWADGEPFPDNLVADAGALVAPAVVERDQ